MAALLAKRPSRPRVLVGPGLVGRTYTRGPAGVLRYESTRPGAGWDRHDWRPRMEWLTDDRGCRLVVIERRRWLRRGTTDTHQDRCPDEVGRFSAVLLTILLNLAAYLLSGRGLLHDRELLPRPVPVDLRTIFRWFHRLLPDAATVQGALRTAAVERCEPQPIERLFPGGLSPPEAVRRRRWKDPEGAYRLATGLAFLVDGADALGISATVLLAEAHKGLDGTLGSSRH